MIAVIGFLVLAVVAVVVYRYVFRATESRLMAAGSATAGLGLFLIALDVVLHVAGSAIG